MGTLYCEVIDAIMKPLHDIHPTIKVPARVAKMLHYLKSIHGSHIALQYLYQRGMVQYRFGRTMLWRNFPEHEWESESSPSYRDFIPPNIPVEDIVTIVR